MYCNSTDILQYVGEVGGIGTFIRLTQIPWRGVVGSVDACGGRVALMVLLVRAMSEMLMVVVALVVLCELA